LPECLGRGGKVMAAAAEAVARWFRARRAAPHRFDGPGRDSCRSMPGARGCTRDFLPARLEVLEVTASARRAPRSPVHSAAPPLRRSRTSCHSMPPSARGCPRPPPLGGSGDPAYRSHLGEWRRRVPRFADILLRVSHDTQVRVRIQGATALSFLHELPRREFFSQVERWRSKVIWNSTPPDDEGGGWLRRVAGFW